MTTPSSTRFRVAVFGPNSCSSADAEIGKEVGRLIAGKNWTLLCGGLGGMMEAAAQGARDAGGTTIGVLPGDNASAANQYIDIPLPTGLGAYRNLLLAQCCDGAIAIKGEFGTLSEISFALRLGKPVVGLHSWRVLQHGSHDSALPEADTPGEAIEILARRLRASKEADPV